MTRRKWTKTYCKFCEKLLDEDTVFPPSCDCEGYVKARKEWVEELKNDLDYKEPLLPEEFDEKYPVTYLGERIVYENDGKSHKIKLEARQYDDGEGLTIWVPFPGSEDEDDAAGLCFDFSSGDVPAILEMLKEYYGDN